MKQQSHSISHQAIRAAIAVLFYLAATSSFSMAIVIDRVVAVVNNEVITLSELNKEVETVSNAIQAEKTGAAPDDQELRERTLDEMIDLRLIEQKANEFNVTVSPEEIDKAYESRRLRMGMEPEEFKTEMLKSGLSEEVFRQKLRANILQNKVVSLDVRSKVVITEEMIQDYYDTFYSTNVDIGNYYLLQMGFAWENSADDEVLKKNKTAAREKAERIHALAVKGEDFKTLAKKFSELPSAVDGGDIGVFAIDEMARSMRSAVENLQPGEVSDIIETAAGYQFFQVVASGEEGMKQTVPLESVKEEIRRKIGEQKMQETFSEWVKNLKEQAYIQKL